MLNKEIKKNEAVMAMISNNSEKKEPKAPRQKRTNSQYKKDNPRSYERHRGRNGTKAMSYYIPDDIITLLNIKAAQDGKTKSELVLEGLHHVLRHEIQAAKDNKAV